MNAPAKVYYGDDASPGVIQSKRVAVVGYGSQGHAHAQNLCDSGVKVKVVLRPDSKSAPKAIEAGFDVITVEEAVDWADVIMFLCPDTEVRHIFEPIKDVLRPGQTIAFAHGLNIHFEWIGVPDYVNVIMIAPKAPGHTVRELFAEGKGVPMLIAVDQDPSGNSFDVALSYAHAIGGTRAGVFQTTFKEETETDLFGEQTVLCGLLVRQVQAAFEVLVEDGYAPEMAYFEVCHELQLIVNLVVREGLAGMLFSISDTAKWGTISEGPTIAGGDLVERLQAALAKIKSGEFAAAWLAEDEAGRPNYTGLLSAAQQHPIEEVGARLRAMMPFIGSSRRLAEVSGG